MLIGNKILYIVSKLTFRGGMIMQNILGLPKWFYKVILLSLFFLHGNLIASIQREEFVEMTGERILKNHQSLKAVVNDCYSKIEKNMRNYFSPGKNWETRGDFDLKKGINLCAAGIEWIQSRDDKFYITEFQPLISSKTGKSLIFSNTTPDQWYNNIINDQYQILAWPYTKRQEIYDVNFLNEQAKIMLDCFKQKRELRKTVYLSEILPNSVKNYEKYKEVDSLEKDIQEELNKTKNKYYYALDTSPKEYETLFKASKDPVSFIKKNKALEKYTTTKDIDFFHSEPLLCWWLAQNLHQQVPTKKEGFTSVFPLISLYTERQTCSIPCEEIIQRLAHYKSFKFIPLISFNSEYKKNKYILVQSQLVSMPEESDFHVPYSIIEPNLRMSFGNLKNNLNIQEPYTLDWNAIKAIHPGTPQLDNEKERPWEKIVRFPIQFKL